VILSKIYNYLIAAAVFIVGAVGIYFKGKSNAKNEARTEATEKTLENVIEAKEIESDVDKMTDSEVNDELEKYYRD